MFCLKILPLIPIAHRIHTYTHIHAIYHICIYTNTVYAHRYTRHTHIHKCIYNQYTDIHTCTCKYTHIHTVCIHTVHICMHKQYIHTYTMHIYMHMQYHTYILQAYTHENINTDLSTYKWKQKYMYQQITRFILHSLYYIMSTSIPTLKTMKSKYICNQYIQYIV